MFRLTDRLYQRLQSDLNQITDADDSNQITDDLNQITDADDSGQITDADDSNQITDADEACRSSEISVDLIIIIVFL